MKASRIPGKKLWGGFKGMVVFISDISVASGISGLWNCIVAAALLNKFKHM